MCRIHELCQGTILRRIAYDSIANHLPFTSSLIVSSSQSSTRRQSIFSGGNCQSLFDYFRFANVSNYMSSMPTRFVEVENFVVGGSTARIIFGCSFDNLSAMHSPLIKPSVVQRQFNVWILRCIDNGPSARRFTFQSSHIHPYRFVHEARLVRPTTERHNCETQISHNFAAPAQSVQHLRLSASLRLAL